MSDLPNRSGLVRTLCPECGARLWVEQTSERFEFRCVFEACGWRRSARDFAAFCVGGGPLGQLTNDDEPGE